MNTWTLRLFGVRVVPVTEIFHAAITLSCVYFHLEYVGAVASFAGSNCSHCTKNVQVHVHACSGL